MSDETQQPPPTGRLIFTEADSPVTRTVISAFMQSYNQYHSITRGTGLEMVMADLVMRARALHQVGEVDKTHLEQFEGFVRELDELMTRVGRMAACTLDFMVKKRGGQSETLETWPDVINTSDDQEM